MPVANTKSTQITNAEAVPATLSEGHLKGDARAGVAVVEVAAADDDNSVFRFARIHSSERLHSLQLLNDAITGGTSYHFGLHETAANGGAAADNDLFATAVDLSSARVAPLDITHEALNIDQSEKRIWELLNLSADPNKFYEITATGITVGTAAGTIAVRFIIVGPRA